MWKNGLLTQDLSAENHSSVCSPGFLYWTNVAMYFHSWLDCFLLLGCRFIHGGQRLWTGVWTEGAPLHAHSEGERHTLHRLPVFSVQPRWSQPRNPQCLHQGVCFIRVYVCVRKERVLGCKASLYFCIFPIIDGDGALFHICILFERVVHVCVCVCLGGIWFIHWDGLKLIWELLFNQDLSRIKCTSNIYLAKMFVYACVFVLR